MALDIRPANVGDAEDIRALVRRAYAPYVKRMDREPAPMRADYGALIAKGHVEIAEQDGQMQGILVCYRDGENLHVENIAVVPGEQGRGLGRTLMLRAETRAREYGLEAIELYTNEIMQENLPFYAALGYEITGRAVEDGYNRIFFRKALKL